jgi:hypothetical protein
MNKKNNKPGGQAVLKKYGPGYFSELKKKDHAKKKALLESVEKKGKKSA